MVVDVHGHITHPELLRRFPMPPALGDVEGMLEGKERAGIDLTIVGSPVGYGTMMPMPGLDNFAQPLDRLQSFHEWLGETVARHPGRLKAYAYTNPFDEELLEHAAEVVRGEEFVGLIVNTSVQGEYLDSPRANAFFDLVDELDVPVFLHPPAEPAAGRGLRDLRLVEQVGRWSDVTVALAAIVFGGRLARHPRLRVLAAMAGGAAALLSGRLDAAARAPAPAPPSGPPPPEPLPEPPSAYLARVYLDTATPSVDTLRANLELVGAEQMLLGTDSPPSAQPLERSLALVDELPVSAEDKAAIRGGNAAKLFGLEGLGV